MELLGLVGSIKELGAQAFRGQERIVFDVNVEVCLLARGLVRLS